jgi:hypothetical protein
MKTLESLKKYKIENEILKNTGGGAHVSGSGSLNGSSYAYDGDVSPTATTGSPSPIIYNVSDFCGQATYDGQLHIGCF